MSLPTFHFVEIATSDDASRLKADRENSSRPAVVEIAQDTTGIGQYRLAKPIIFPIVFRKEPHLVYGSAVLKAADAAVYHDPRGSAGVWGWKRSGAGNYLGAFLWLRVDCDTVDPDSEQPDATALNKVSVRLFLTFTGVAIKALPTEKLTPTLKPRTVGIP